MSWRCQTALLLSVALGGVACGPRLLHYTVRIESVPSGAQVYDPRTDEVIGETPLVVPLEYQRDGFRSYQRRQSAFDQYTPQDPESKHPRTVSLDSKDSVRVLVVKEGHERLDQLLDWYFSEVDGQVIKKRVYLRPMGEVLDASDDVFR